MTLQDIDHRAPNQQYGLQFSAQQVAYLSEY